MVKIGRNAPCPCNSGKKYKRCCGAVTAPGPTASGLPPEVLRSLSLEISRQEAKEHRRRLMQGLGRPIISAESHGYRIVAVGNGLRWSKTWLTFHDFLFDYIKIVLTSEWGNAELAKPDGACHPLIGWYRRVCKYQEAHVAAKQGKIYTGQMTGVMKAYLGLAYDLYLSAHNAELPPLLLKRLRNAKTFEGALYEAFVIGSFAKAGFSVEFENETDSTVSHCEFTATHKETGRKFSVEAKAVASTSGRAAARSKPPKIRGLLYDALRKAAAHERIIFIELNRAQTMMENGEPDWAAQVDQELAAAERELTIDGQPAPQAYLFLTNRAFMHALDDPDCSEAGIAHGFKIDKFPTGRGAKSMLEAVEARKHHLELHWLLKAMEARAVIPSTFDDRTPEEVFSEEQTAPLRIGDTYLVSDGTGSEVPGLLYDGTVNENERKAFCVYRLPNGQHIICTVPLSDAELARYRQSPDTFFGVIKHVSKGLKYPMDMYDFLYGSYSKTPRDKLLEFMAQWPEIEAWRDLSQEELAKRYCARMAEGMWAQFAPMKPSVPECR